VRPVTGVASTNARPSEVLRTWKCVSADSAPSVQRAAEIFFTGRTSGGNTLSERAHGAVGEQLVFLAYLVIGELRGSERGFRCFAEDHDTGGFLVEAMNDAGCPSAGAMTQPS